MLVAIGGVLVEIMPAVLGHLACFACMLLLSRYSFKLIWLMHLQSPLQYGQLFGSLFAASNF